MNGELDPALVSTVRLRVMTIAASATAVEFATLRDALAVSDSVLSKHLAALASEGYVATSKDVCQGRRTTWVRVTSPGRRALVRHVRALREIIAGVGEDPGAPPPAG